MPLHSDGAFRGGMMAVEIKCRICGNVFWVAFHRKDTAKYCSRKCHGKSNAIEMKGKPSNFGGIHPTNNQLRIGINCKVCGKLKKIGLCLYLSGQKTCSMECRNIAKKKYPLKAICKNCGNEFKPDPCNNLVFCNRACYAEYKKKQAERMFICNYCGKEMKIVGRRSHGKYYRYYNGKKEVRKYCSNNCVNMDKTGIRGENHFNWKGGRTALQDLIRKSSYSQNYRKECFQRDGWKSVLSGNNGRLEHHHLMAFSILIKEHNITKNNWIDFKDILFDLNNTVTLTEKEHDKFHSVYGKITTPEQFEEFRNSGGLR